MVHIKPDSVRVCSNANDESDRAYSTGGRRTSVQPPFISLKLARDVGVFSQPDFKEAVRRAAKRSDGAKNAA